VDDLFLLLLAGHLLGDWLVQTDWQALNKAAATGWFRANQLHCLTYHVTMAVAVLPVWHTWETLLAFAISWASHGFIDRRWPVRWLLRKTGSPGFAEQTWGVIATDQALHLTILALIAVAAG
jgi:hypothetical protein